MSLLDFWLKAMSLPVGLWIKTDDRQLLRMQLYRARAESQRQELDGIVIIFPEEPTELWLVHRDADQQGRPEEGYPQSLL